MKEAILLDTNIWLDFLRKPNGGEIIDTISYLQESKNVSFLLPQLLRKEWDEQKNKYIRKQSEPDGNFGVSRHIVDTIAESALASNLLLLSKIETVMDRCEHISIPDSAKIRTSDMSMHGRAPFHNNPKSMSDGLIIFSAIDWCKKNNLCLYFITNNTKDFSDCSNKNNIHPDLLDPEVKIKYYLDIFLAIRSIDPSSLIKSKNLPDANIPIIPVDLTGGTEPENQLLEAFDYYNKHIYYFGRYLLSRLFPFCSSSQQPIGHTNTSMYINNPALIEYLRNQEKSDPHTINPKVREIYGVLSQHFIYELEVFKPEFKFNCKEENIIACTCVRCMYKRLDFKAVIASLKAAPGDDVYDNLREAYVRFLLHDYGISATFLLNAYKQVEKEKIYIIKLSTSQNVASLNRRIISRYDQQNIPKDMTDVEDSDLIFAGNLNLNPFIREASKLIYRNSYPKRLKSQILEKHSEIRNHCQKQMAGGYSSNNFLRSILILFDELTNFIEINVLISNGITELMQDCCYYVFDACLMHYILGKGQGGRLTHFNDPLLKTAIFYGNDTGLRKLLRQYKIETLKYKYGDEGSSIVEQTIRLLSDSKELFYYKTEEEMLHRMNAFQGSLSRFLSNSILLCAFLEFTEEDDKRIATSITSLVLTLSKESSFCKDVSGVLDFLWLKPGAFTEEQIRSISLSLLKNAHWWSKDWFRELGRIVTEKKPNICTTNLHFSQKIYDGVDSANAGNVLTFLEDIMNWFGPLHQDFKLLIKKRVQYQLEKSFFPDLYYSCAIHDVLHFQKYLDSFAASINVGKAAEVHPFLADKLANCPRLSELLNLAFKESIPTNSSLFKRFFGISEYYDWLLDMDNFDYSDFIPEWVLEYQTCFYLQKIFSNKKCKMAIEKHLADRPNAAVSDLYFKHFVSAY